MFSDCRLVYSVGNADRVERPKTLAFWCEERQTARSERLREREVIPLVTRPPRFESLLLDDRERFVERVHERGRHRVMVLALRPIFLEQREIEIEAAALDTPLECPRREDDRRQSGRRAQTFLRAAVDRVEAPCRYIERMAAERRDRVHDRQSVVLPRNRRQLANRIEDAGRFLRMNQTDDLR